MSKSKKFGLIGKNISYSFSKNYFTKKFKNLGLDNYSYDNFDMQSIDEFPLIYENFKGEIGGINVTIPYKEEIIKYLDDTDQDAKKIGAVNTIKITEEGKLIGYNTDIYGFEESLKPLLKPHVKNALVLGTGGASKAIAFVLNKNNISCNFVSRNPSNDKTIAYEELTKKVIKHNHLIINCTPIGTFPNVENAPSIPYKFLSNRHILFDLVYNPEVTKFLKNGMKRGAIIKNGEEMLKLQANKAWDIWNS